MVLRGGPGPYLAPLNKQIPPGPDEVSRVEAGLVLCGHELALGRQPVSVLHRTDGVVLEGGGEMGETSQAFADRSNDGQ